MKVLVADDDAVTRTLLQAGLKKWGYQVIPCSDGAQAWEILQQRDAPILILVDWVMPGIDGVEL